MTVRVGVLLLHGVPKVGSMSETTRRRFLQYGLGGGALLALPATARRGWRAANRAPPAA